MAIVVIAREIAALGDETAKVVAENLGYRYISKEEFDDKLTTCGLDHKCIGRYEEKKPDFISSLSSVQNKYLHYLKSVLYEETVDGDCVIVGQGAPVILRGIPGVITVRLIAPEQTRIARIKERYNCDDKKANHIMNQTDHDRAGFYQYFFDITWKDPVNYDFVVNTENLTVAQVASIVKALVDTHVKPEQESAGKSIIQGNIRSQKIVSEVIYNQKLPIYFFETKCDGDSVVLSGVTNIPSAVERAIDITKTLDGCANVISNIYIATDIPISREF